eukprot:EG_transcript_26687
MACQPFLQMMILICSGGIVLAQSTGNKTSVQNVVFTIYMKKAGLCNQLFAFLHSLLVATALKWDYEIPEFLYHSNGAVPYDRQVFQRTSMSKLLDVKRMQEAFRARGTNLHTFGSIGPTHDIVFKHKPNNHPLSDWILRAKANIAKEKKRAPKGLPPELNFAADESLQNHQSLQNLGQTQGHPPTRIIDPLRALRLINFHPGPGDVAIGHSGWQAFKELVNLIYFAPKLEAIANRVIRRLKEK